VLPHRNILLIFDCDGVLIDSEIISLAIDAEMLTKLGLPHTVQDVAKRFLGVSVETANKMIEQDLGHPIPEAFNTEYHSRLAAAFEKDLKIIPGVMEFLDQWPGSICVASSSSQARLKTTLTQVGLFTRFAPHIYSAEMVSRGKPEPDLFLYAANNMGFAPDKCIVIEDSINGVKAARAARMRCLGFVGGSHCNAEHAKFLRDAGAEQVFAKMDQLFALI